MRISSAQETKATPEQVAETLKGANGYHVNAYGAVKPGYSGTAIASKEKPVTVGFGIGMKGHDDEGRVVCACSSPSKWAAVRRWRWCMRSPCRRGWVQESDA